METKKPYYSIGQVAEYLELPQSVLRYWETVFDALNPAKSPGGSRRYSDLDLKILNDIKHLLYDRGFTIRGANKILNQKYHVEAKRERQNMQRQNAEATAQKETATEPARASGPKDEINQKLLKHIIAELKEIVKLLDE